MTATLATPVPPLRIHKASGQGYVYLNGKRFYLGKRDKPETLQAYHRLIAEWASCGGQLAVDPECVTIKELIARFWVWAELLDDPQTRQSAASPTQTKYRLSILNGDVLGMAGPNVKIAGFMTCTKIYHDDLADRVLDRQRNPEWQGECTKMLYSFPSSQQAEKLWDQYAQLRAEGLREGDGGKRATAFYGEHRETMDVGSKIAWPQRYNGDEQSALQHAINLKLRDEEAFFAEYQNEPLAHKLWTMRVSQCESGEVFAVLSTNPRVDSPVKLDLRLIEADQVTTPCPRKRDA